jgi:large exoprotein involved in heme utilization and adhesion
MTKVTLDSSTLFAMGDSGSVTLKTEGQLSMIDSTINTLSLRSGNAGAITVTGSDVTLDGVGIVADLIGDGVSTSQSGAVTLGTEQTSTVIVSNSIISNNALESVADGSPIQITGTTIALLNGEIDATSDNQSVPTASKGGDIEIRGSDVQLRDFRLTSLASGLPESTGTGGSIRFMDAQNIQLIASRVNTNSNTLGGAGSIEFQTVVLGVSEGSQVSSATVGPGPGGTIIVQGNSPASSILIDGTGSGIFTNTDGTGAGGNMFLNANTVTLQNGGRLSAETSGTAPSATGGNITVAATNTVTMNSASITASSTGTADAGSINITSPNGFTMQNSTITTQAGQGAGGGNIKVTTSRAATVRLQNSKISASVADGRGGGGNISIDPQFVILQNSQILAQAAQGQGGAITITASLFLPDAISIVNADSGSGVNGTVTIQSPNAPASGKIQPLGKSPLQATSLLNQRCASLAGGEFSSFTVAGRDSLPTEPGSWLASPLALGPAGFSADSVTEGGEQARVIDLAQETTVLSLRQIAPAGFLTQAFAVDESTGCQS